MPPARSADRLFSPLDEELGLLPGDYTPLLHQRLVEVGNQVPSFDRAGQLFTRFTGTPVSEATVRRYVERAGQVMLTLPTVAPTPPAAVTVEALPVEAANAEASEAVDAEAPTAETPTAEAANAEAANAEAANAEASEAANPEASEAAVVPARPTAKRFLTSVDGAHVPLVGGRWEEVRTLVIAEVRPGRDGEPECTQLSYFSRKASAEAFVEQAAAEVARRGLEQAAAVCFGSDGAPWCQRFPDRYCPEAARGLDFWHAAEHVHAFSKDLWPQSAGNQQWWSETMLHDLKHRGPDRMLHALAGWQAIGGRTKTGKSAGATLDYFAARTELLDYPQLRAAGWPIGTGAVESANKLVVEERLKGPGMHWGDTHVNPMLALRNAQCSGRWDEAWAATAAVLTRNRPTALSVHTKT